MTGNIQNTFPQFLDYNGLFRMHASKQVNITITHEDYRSITLDETHGIYHNPAGVCEKIYQSTYTIFSRITFISPWNSVAISGICIIEGTDMKNILGLKSCKNTRKIIDLSTHGASIFIHSA
jgi:hypothetical protein